MKGKVTIPSMNLPFGEWPSGSILFNPIMWGCMLPPKSLYYFH